MTTHPAQDADNKNALEALNRAWVEAELVMKPEFESYYGTIRRALTTTAPQSEKMYGRLLEAFGMFLNGMAYYETFPDNEEDAKQLSKSATYNFLRARNHIDEQTADACSMACKAVYTDEYKKENNNG